MQQRYRLLKLLADGKFHSGEALASSIGVSRAAIWKRLQNLSDWGVECYSVKGRGYRLNSPLNLLNHIAYFCDRGLC